MPPLFNMLVIGYGNELRGDDGVGPKTAAAVEQLKLPGVRCLTRHQLTPELAEEISRANKVIFVDAATGETEVRIREVAPAVDPVVRAHSADPAALLTLGKQLFGTSPKAWMITIPVENTTFGEELSPRARRGLETAVEEIKKLA